MAEQIRKALVVDDSRMARTTLSKLLDKRGIAVDVAESGQGAVAYMDANEPPDAVFMDYTMPDIDGIEAIRQIRERHGDGLPMAMYTSQEGDEERERARALGVTAFLMKPATEARLGDVLDQLAETATPSSEAPADTSAAETAHKPEPAAAQRPSSVAQAMGAEGTASERSRAGQRASASDEAPPAGAAGDESAAGSPDQTPLATDTATAPSTGEAGDEATSRVEAVAEQTATRIAEAKAREVAESVVQAATETIAAQASPAAAKQAISEIRKDVATQIDNALQSEAFSSRVSQAFTATVWPEIREQVADEIAASMHDEMHRIARDAASELTRQQTDETKTVAQKVISERESALRMQLNQDASQEISAVEARLKTLIIGVGAGLGVAMAGGFAVLAFMG